MPTAVQVIMQRLLRSIGIAASLSFAASAMSACSDATQATLVIAPDSTIGTYVLQSVDGVAVPGTSGGQYWQDGSLAINANQTFVQVLHVSGTPSGSIVLNGTSGTW